MNKSPLILRLCVAPLLVVSTQMLCVVARADEGPKPAKSRAKPAGELLQPVAKQSAGKSPRKRPARSGGGRGTFQDALAQGHKLGAIASSDHRSTNISFAGVYVESIDRAGVFEGIHARRTIAATDKIFMKLTCGDHLLGEVFTTNEKPTLNLAIDGTAPLKWVTVIRNETIIYSHQPEDDAGYEGTFSDMDPVRQNSGDIPESTGTFYYRDATAGRSAASTTFPCGRYNAHRAHAHSVVQT